MIQSLPYQFEHELFTNLRFTLLRNAVQPLGAGHYLSAGGGEGLGNYLVNPSFLRRPPLPNIYYEVDPPTTDGL